MKRRLQSRILPVGALNDQQRQEMFRLFSDYYIDVSFEDFCQDLSEKTHVFYFRDASGIVGFSTIFRRRMPQISRGIFLFSGDTVIRRDYWGTKVLQMQFFRMIVESKVLAFPRPVYWMLISKGYKTYLMMRRNFPRSYPAPDRRIPTDLQRVKDAFYTGKFGGAYRADSGLIEFERSHGAVKGGMADPPASLAADREVQHFLTLNPRFRDGVELACVTEIRFRDFLFHIPKYFLKPIQKLVKQK